MPGRPTPVPVSQWGLFSSARPLVIAGPCSAESCGQVLETARGLAHRGVSVFRAGLWKPRTHPGGFEGVGEKGLEWLCRVREETGLSVATEVAGARHVEACLAAGIDLLWIGARTTASPFLVQEIADALRGTDVPVLVKNPLSPDPGLWMGAIERLEDAGIRRLGLVHRGFSSPGGHPYRNLPLWQLAIDMRTRCPELPFFADPSHMGGDRSVLRELSQKALDLGLDGLMIEVHAHPEAALSDAAQQITPEALQELLGALHVRERDTDDADYRAALAALRARIDDIDAQLLDAFAARTAVSREIGRYKKEHNVAILQAGRWEALLAEVVTQGQALGLSEAFLRRVFAAIHDESVRVQEEDASRRGE